jgi:hypothetical protein
MYFKSQEANLGIRDNSYNKDRILLYPNPTSGDLYITGVNEACTLQLISVTGAVIYQEQISGDTRIDIKYLPGGTYLVKMNDHIQGRILKK